MIKSLNKILEFISINKLSVRKQEEYLKKIKEPLDNIERSYNQYLCQMKLIGNRLVVGLINFISFPVLLLLFIFINNNNNNNNNNKADLVIFLDGKPKNIVPNSIFNKYKKNYTIIQKHMSLEKNDKKYIYKIFKKHPYSFYFLLKILIKISYYRYVIQSYNPESILVCNEYSFTSSVLTDYCNYMNIMHINVMHGEKLYNIRDSFFKYNECYVWDEYYVDLFKTLRADPHQFIIEIPESMINKNTVEIIKKNDYIYYLGNEHGKRLKNIIIVMKKLQSYGKKVSIRPHPRYTDYKELHHLCKGIEIENVNAIKIEDSLLMTKNAISQFSTVLNQAYNYKINIVIDDITDKKNYLTLKERKYIMLNKSHKLLSEILLFNQEEML